MTKITQLPADASPTTTDIVPTVDTETTTTKKSTLASLITLFFANIPSAVITNTSLKTGTGEPGGAWNAWTPTFTSLTLGNGTASFYYKQIGKTVICRVALTFGSSSSMSTAPKFTLPVTAASISTNTYLGTCRILDAAVAGYVANFMLDSTTTVTILGVSSLGTYAGEYGLASAVPFTWGTGDGFFGVFIYEAA